MSLQSFLVSLESAQLSPFEVAERLKEALTKSATKRIPLRYLRSEHREVAFQLKARGEADIGRDSEDGDFLMPTRSWMFDIQDDFRLMFRNRSVAKDA